MRRRGGPPPNGARLAALNDRLDRACDDEEIRDLCVPLGVAYDNLGSHGTRANIRELVQLLDRQQRRPALIAEVARRRPGDWFPRPPSTRATYGHLHATAAPR